MDRNSPILGIDAATFATIFAATTVGGEASSLAAKAMKFSSPKTEIAARSLVYLGGMGAVALLAKKRQTDEGQNLT